jgi:ABC-type polysaccharide/polyol phosphate export permease
VETQLTRPLPAAVGYRSTRVVGGIVWAIVQPWRLTLLHPHHQGFWWLAVEPPLLVVAAGIFFSVAIARPLVSDLEEHRGAPR